MDIKELETKREAVKARYDEVQKAVNDGNAELARLQGDFRTINSLIDDLKAKEEPAKAKKE